LSIDNLSEIEMLSVDSFLEKWAIDLSKPNVLITIHPETVHAARNEAYVKEVEIVLQDLIERYQLIFTMPNADTAGSVWRNLFQKIVDGNGGRAFAIENFGTQSYFTCISKSSFLLGNTSSGIIEAASFGKYAINVGDRQKGRTAGSNVIHVPFSSAEILNAVNKVEAAGDFKGDNLYFKGGAVLTIINSLKTLTF
jgi:GDP/UDP-N,N'-diacetylbacillosamine 2-epimerase (hydrolysing)